MTRGILDSGVIIIRDGRIQEVGKDVAIPAGTRIIEASTSYIFPGFIDAGTNLGTVELETIEKDDDEATLPLTPHLRTIDAFNPESRLIPEALDLGVTTVLVAPARGNLLSGQSALIYLGGSHLSETVIRTAAAVHGSLGDVSKPRSKLNQAYPYTRMGGAALLRQTLADARYYLDRALEFEKKRKDGQAEAAAGPKPPLQPMLEALVPVVKGDLPLVVTANRLDDILTALRIAQESGIRIIISEGAQAWRVRDRLAALKLPVILRPRVDFGSTVETVGGRHENAALLQGAGVKIAFQTGSIQNLGDLLLQARVAVGYGLAPEDALRALTINPAEIFGVGDEIGSLEKGKSADIVIFPGNPILSSVRASTVIIRGRVVRGPGK
jgi:imidazolonepropionase-like amidohydrolase